VAGGHNGVTKEDDIKEWLRRSFLIVDEEIQKPVNQDFLANIRRTQPPNKPPLLMMLEQSKP
jgi:serine/threonine protein phosphatase PrpC